MARRSKNWRWYLWRTGDKLWHWHVGHHYPLREVRKKFISVVNPRVRTKYGHQLNLSHDDFVMTPYLQQTGEWEKEEGWLMESVVKPGQKVLDIGANIGYFTVLLAELVGVEGNVWAFEPDQENFQLLAKNIAINNFSQLVKLHQQGVAEKTTHATLFMNDENKGDHRLVGESAQARQRISVVALDELAELQNVDINFIKMDIQGAEWRALQGMKKLIRRSKNLQLLMEYWPAGLVAQQTRLQALHRFLDHYFIVKELRMGRRGVRDVTWSELITRAKDDLAFSTNLWCVRRKNV